MFKVKATDTVKMTFKELNSLNFPSIYIFHYIMYVKAEGSQKNYEIHNYNTRNCENFELPCNSNSRFEKRECNKE